LPIADALAEAAGDVRCLLLVDNCEHVIGEAAELVAKLLAAGGELRVLATSREPLGISGEVSYQVPMLPAPAADAGVDAATAAGYDAVRLFVDRAAAASPGFTLTDVDASAVSALCWRLDGLPLAIELAASRVCSFAPAQLVAHLDERFDLLSGGPPRHRLPAPPSPRRRPAPSSSALSSSSRTSLVALPGHPGGMQPTPRRCADHVKTPGGAELCGETTPAVDAGCRVPRCAGKAVPDRPGWRSVRGRWRCRWDWHRTDVARRPGSGRGAVGQTASSRRR
jgi:predicted ATPase